jgi:hypothetical protein
MLKRVGLFGVRRRVNEIVDFINEVNEQDEQTEVDISPWIESVNGRFEGALALFGMAFRFISQNRQSNKALQRRVKQLEMGKRIDDESLGFCLEAVEGLDARLSLLEDALSLPEIKDEMSESNPDIQQKEPSE